MSARPETFRPESKIDALRVPPHSVEAEQSVLGGLMLDPASWAKVGDWLTEEDFYRRDHRLIYRVIREQVKANKPVDVVTLGEWLEANNLDSHIGDTGYLIELRSMTPSAANIVAYAEIVAEKSKLRQLIEVGTEAVNDGFSPNGRESALVISETQRKLTRLIGSAQHVGPQPPRNALKTWFQDLQARWEADDRMTGVVSPWHDINELTFGWQAGELIIVAARPNVGKSVFGFQQLAFTGLRGSQCLAFSLEMSYPQVLQRMVAALGEIPHDWLRSPANSDEDHWPLVNTAVRDLMAASFIVDDQPRLTAEQIVARAKRGHMRSPLSLIVVDHLHDMRRPGKDLVNEIGDDCRVLKALAKDLNVPVMVLAQLNRQVDDRPVLKDLRASGSIEEVADLVLLMHRQDYQKFDGREKSPVEIIFAKGRNLPTGRTVYLKNRYDVQRLDDLIGYVAAPKESETKPRARGFDAKRAATGERP